MQEVTKILPIVNPYAAWRAECIKADIEAGLDDDSAETLTPEELKAKRRKDYQQRYYQQHKQQRIRYAKGWNKRHPECCKEYHKKAACDCNRKAANRNNTTPSL